MGLLVRTLLIVSVFASVTAVTTDIGCDPGWLIYSGNCYLFNNQKRITWNEAITECNRYDSSPIYFELSAELTWYQNVTKTQYPSYGYWTNMNQIANGDPNAPGVGWWSWGMHEYIDTTIVLWSSSPANDGQPACGGVNLQGNMYDADCSSRQGFICQLDGAVQNGGCPMAWMNTDVDCFYISNTTDPAGLQTWQDAKAQCTSLYTGSHLFVIDDANDTHLDGPGGSTDVTKRQGSMYKTFAHTFVIDVYNDFVGFRKPSIIATETVAVRLRSFLQGQLPYLSVNSYLHWTGLQGSGYAGGWGWVNGATFNQQLFSWAMEPDNVANRENCGVVRYNGKFSDRSCDMKQNYICKKPESEMDSTWNLGCGLWTRAGSKCYMFYQDPKSDWMTAKQTCQSFQGDLINVYDTTLRSWLQQQMMDPANAGRMYWTALNDRSTEGVYQWGDGSTLNPTTISWNTEPNNWMGDEDCAYMYVTGEFNDVTCAFKSAPLCELDNIQTCPTKGGTWVSRAADTGSGLNCYLFGAYRNQSQLMTQSEASDFCSSLAFQMTNQAGATISYVPKLYSVDSQAEITFIVQQMQKYLDNANGYWTSLNDRATEGFWQWGNNVNSDVSLVNWNMEPSTTTPDTDCVGTGYGGNFYVRRCSVKFPFICERSANTPWTTGAASSTRATYLTAVFVLIASIIRLLQ